MANASRYLQNSKIPILICVEHPFYPLYPILLIHNPSIVDIAAVPSHRPTHQQKDLLRCSCMPWRDFGLTSLPIPNIQEKTALKLLYFALWFGGCGLGMCVCVMAIFGHYKDNLLFYGVIRETMLKLAKCQFGLISKLRRSVGGVNRAYLQLKKKFY